MEMNRRATDFLVSIHALELAMNIIINCILLRSPHYVLLLLHL